MSRLTMKHAVYVSNLSILKISKSAIISSEIEKSSFIYCGCEFCENAFPAFSEISEVITNYYDKGKSFVIVTPFLTEKGIMKINNFIDVLMDLIGEMNYSIDRFEICINDFGVFELLAEKKIKIKTIIGRILSDSFLIKDSKKILVDPDTFKYFRNSFNATRYEISYTADFNKNKFKTSQPISDLSISLYYPFSCLSAKRVCFFNRKKYVAENAKPGITCNRECSDIFFIVDHECIRRQVIINGTGIFAENPVVENSFKLGTASTINRLVYCPYPPY